MDGTMMTRGVRFALIAAAWVGAAACEQAPVLLPTEAEAEAIYEGQNVDVSISGNVVVLTAVQSTDQLRRGGSLWAKVGPYIYLFSDPTRELLTRYDGVGGVRVTTRTSGGTEIASVLMPRDALNDLTWRRALNISGLARRDGSSQLSRLSDLVEWGEEHTDFEYNSQWVGE